MSRSTGGFHGGWVMTLLLVACTALLLLSDSSRRSVREELAQVRLDQLRLQSGDFLPEFIATSTDGQDFHFGDPDGPAAYVALVMTAGCPYCRATIPQWNSLAERISGDPSLADVQTIGFTSDSLAVAGAFADSAILSFPLVPFPDVRTFTLFRGQVVPQTVVVLRDGRVVFVRHRAILDDLAVDSVLHAVAEARERTGRDL